MTITPPGPATRHPSPDTRPVGLLGGTFDPIHFGHLRLAEELAEGLGLERVHILPAGTPPHRGQPQAAADRRLAMVRLAIAGNPRFVPDETEINKAGPCYMVDTLTALREKFAGPLILLLGIDAFAGLPGWHQWRRLFDLAHVAVAGRPGYGQVDALPGPLANELGARLAKAPQDLLHAPHGRVFLQTSTRLDISASRIRELVAAGRSPRYLLPDAVLDYINLHHLYR